VVIAGNHELCLGYADGYCDPSTVERICGQSGAEAIDAKVCYNLITVHLAGESYC